MTKLKLVATASLAIAVCCVAGTASPRPAQTAAGKLNIAFVGADLPDPFYLTMKCGAYAAAKKYDVALSWQGTNGVDYAPELTTFNAVRQKNPQGIILAPFSATAFVSPVAQTMKAGIPVVTVDGSLSKKVELENIRTDNLHAGALAADGLAKAIGGSGDVAVVSFSPDIPVQKDRVDGFRRELAKKFPKVKVVAVEYGGADSGKSATVTAAILQKNSNLAGLYATDTNDANGAASAIQAAGSRGKVKLVAYDATPQAVAGLKSGLFNGIVSQSPYDEGFQAVKTLALYVNKKLPKAKIPYLLGTGSAYIDKANVGKPSLKKYLYRATC